MDHNKGSLILKALSPETDEALLTAYLAKRAKNIPTDKIPLLYKKLPVVLSYRVSAPTARLVIAHLNAMGAEAVFQPATDQSAAPDCPDGEQEEKTRPPELREPLTNRIRSFLTSPRGREAALLCAAVLIAGLLSMLPGLAWLWPVFYALPGLAAAFLLGLRPGLCAASAGILLAVVFGRGMATPLLSGGAGLLAWALLLVSGSAALGYLRSQNMLWAKELRQTYQGVLLLLNHFTDKNEEQKNHCIRVSIYATRIATLMGMESNKLEALRAAARLHDLVQLKTSRGILRKAMRQNSAALFTATTPAEHPLLDNRLAQTLPLLLAYHEWREHPSSADAQDLPLGTKILAVADAYDTLTAGHGLASSPIPAKEARDRILSQQERPLDPEVLKAFTLAFDRMELDLPANIL
ncbi:MAG: HD-GYP domain-containing protein [Desulfobulbus sp.]|jgi:hypothetical protein